MKKSYLTALCMASAAIGFAVPFDTSTVGGTATVGSGGDYASLKAASEAFNALGSPYLQGDWKLEILNDLNEPANSFFGNTIPDDASLTLKPAAETSVTLTFEATVDNGGGAGASGHLVIGSNNADEWVVTPTSNFIVDGSNNGTDSRNMTLQNTAALTHTFASPITIVGASQDITVQNTTIRNVSTATGSSVAGITVATRVDTVLGVVHAPANISIINNSIHVPQTQGHGINFRQSSTGGTAPAIIASVTGTRIINNDIVSRLRGIFIDSGLDGDITSNTISIGYGPAVTGYPQSCIWINNSRSTADQVLNVEGNRLLVRSANTSANDYGPAVIRLGGTGATHQANVINNMISFEFTSTAATAFNYIGIQALGAYTYNILHNSIDMPNFPNLTGFTPVRAAGIKMSEAGAYTATIRNNIVRVNQAGVAGISLVHNGTTTPNVTSNNNNIYLGQAGAYTGATGTAAAVVPHQTLADWLTATGHDANSTAVDPKATTGSNWTLASGATDLHFYPSNVKPVELTLQPRLTEAPVDFDGQAREELTVPGADEVLTTPASVNDWNVY